MSPTQRSLAVLRKAGWTCAVVEQWIPTIKIRRDLFGFADVLAIHPRVPDTMAIQVTSSSNLSARLKKIMAEPRVFFWLASPYRRIEVWGWAKRGARGKRKTYQLRRLVLWRNLLGDLVALTGDDAPVLYGMADPVAEGGDGADATP